MSRDALNFAQEFYEQPNLRVSEVKPTELIDFENIGLRFRVNIKVVQIHKPIGLEISFWAPVS